MGEDKEQKGGLEGSNEEFEMGKQFFKKPKSPYARKLDDAITLYKQVVEQLSILRYETGERVVRLLEKGSYGLAKRKFLGALYKRNLDTTTMFEAALLLNVLRSDRQYSDFEKLSDLYILGYTLKREFQWDGIFKFASTQLVNRCDTEEKAQTLEKIAQRCGDLYTIKNSEVRLSQVRRGEEIKPFDY
jgi:hypothetical protein